MSVIDSVPARSSSPPVAQLPSTSPRSTSWTSIARGFPNLIVFSMLAGVMYFGHHTDWKMPKASALWGGGSQQVDDWCSAHLVPESLCIECKPELDPMGRPFGLCREHGVAECVEHHPELAQVQGPPKSPKYDTVRAIGLIARPENNSRSTLHTHRIQFASAESVTKSGVEVDVVQERPMTDAISANGEIAFDPTRVAHLSTRVPGTVALVRKSLGDDVQPNEILALVDSNQVGQIKSQLLQAIVHLQLRRTTVERLRGLTTGGSIPQKSLIEAESALQEAEIAFVSARQALANLGFNVPDELDAREAKRVAEELRFLDIPASLSASLPATTMTANLIPIRSPSQGVVVASEVVAGEVVDITRMLFTVADPRQLWLMLSVRQEDARYVKRGLPVEFTTDDKSAAVAGQVSWISPAINEQTRTLSVRVAIGNPDGVLRDKTFGTGRIVLRKEPNAIVVPRESVQSSHDAHFVFVRDRRYFDQDGAKVFHVRQVRIGAGDEQYVELLAGVLPGEVIATKGSPMLLAQLLRGSLGAGCACHKP